MREFEIIRYAAPVAYNDMLAVQHARRAEVATGTKPNTLYLLEHTPVITRGRNAQPQHLLATPELLRNNGVDLIDADRGGDVTYHGPGQLVAYPILRLQEWRPSVGWYLRTLEQVLIDLLASYEIAAWREDGLTGVWTARGKVAAIGVGLHQWCTCHGIALNIAPNMDHFRLIVPCGIGDKPVTSLAELLPTPPPRATVEADFQHIFLSHFA